MRKTRLLRLLVVPALTLAISIASIEVCISVAKKQTSKMVDEEVILVRDNISQAIKQYIEYAAYVEYGFVSSFCSRDTAGLFRYLEGWKGYLEVEDIYERMQSFLSFYPEFGSVGIYLEEGVLFDEGGGRFAGSMRGKGKGGSAEPVKDFKIFDDPLYRRGADTLLPGYYSQILELPGEAGPSSIHVIPMYDSKDALVGEIWFKYDLNLAGKFFGSLKQCMNSAVFLVDQDDAKVDMTNLSGCAGVSVLDVLDSLSEGTVSALERYTIGKAIAGGEELTLPIKEGLEVYRVYVSELDGHNLSLVQILTESQVYKSIIGFKYALLLLSVIAILAVFLLSALSFRKLYASESENITVRGEMKIASGLQEHLLPPSMPDVPEVRVDAVQRQAQFVGGDLYDCRVRRGKMLVCIGDVSGKGVPACMYMSMVSSHLRAMFQMTSDTAVMMTGINEAICDRNATLMFCTMFVGVLDLETGEMEYCNAGHDRPALRTSDGWSFLAMEKNVPIGIEPGFKYVSQKLTLAPSDCLFLYTDGVTEARSSTGDLFGETRLIEFLRHSGPYSVLPAIENFSCGAPQSDDITMLGITYIGKA